MKNKSIFLIILIAFALFQGRLGAQEDMRGLGQNVSSNLIVNGDFEDFDLSMWVFFRGSTFMIDPKEGRGNSHGATFMLSGSMQTDGIFQEIYFRPKFEKILIEGWIRVVGNEASASFLMECLDSSKKDTYGREMNRQLYIQRSDTVKGNASWKEISMQVAIPKETTKIVLYVEARGKEGIVYFDDIKIREVNSGMINK